MAEPHIIDALRSELHRIEHALGGSRSRAGDPAKIARLRLAQHSLGLRVAEAFDSEVEPSTTQSLTRWLCESDDFSLLDVHGRQRFLAAMLERLTRPVR